MKDQIDVSESEFSYEKGDELVDREGTSWNVEDIMFSAYSGEHFYYLCETGGGKQMTKTGRFVDNKMHRDK